MVVVEVEAIVRSGLVIISSFCGLDAPNILLK
jgi:hypothetical protein